MTHSTPGMLHGLWSSTRRATNSSVFTHTPFTVVLPAQTGKHLGVVAAVRNQAGRPWGSPTASGYPLHPHCESLGSQGEVALRCHPARRGSPLPELSAHVFRAQALDDEDVLHGIKQHVAGVANVDSCL